MKLYDLPRNTWFKVLGIAEPILFHHLDGMYSYCTLKNGDVVHIVGYAEVDVLENYK